MTVYYLFYCLTEGLYGTFSNLIGWIIKHGSIHFCIDNPDYLWLHLRHVLFEKMGKILSDLLKMNYVQKIVGEILEEPKAIDYYIIRRVFHQFTFNMNFLKTLRNTQKCFLKLLVRK